jgi:phage repressor protein C with HTH and peptisase S24 domain
MFYSNDMTPWERINAELLRRHSGWQKLANHLNFDIQRVHNWKSRGIPSKQYRSIADFLGQSIDWIEGLEEQPKEVALENNPDYPSIRRVTFKLSAGTSGFGVDYDSKDSAAPIVFAKSWYEGRSLDPAKLFAVKVANGSMESGLYDGDTVVVNTAQTAPKDGHVFAANFEGQLVIKRLQRDAGEWWLSSDNPDQRRYPRKICDENCFLIGEIVHKQSERI